jgi:2-haloalkanoic acid dehalogenase type II
VLEEVLQRIAARLGVEASVEEVARFGRSAGEWPAFPDTVEALARLKARFRLIIVSNVDRDSFAGSNRRLGVAFDRIITAEDVGSYKPHPAHFEALQATLPSLGVDRHQLLHVAQSLFHDHEPAQRHGLESVWIDRRSDREGGATPLPTGAVHPRWRFPSLADFADAVEANP